MRVFPIVVLMSLCACGGATKPSVETEMPEAKAAAASDAGPMPDAPPPPTVTPIADIPEGVERLFALKPPAGAPARGAADAKVVMQVFSDFQCPFCASLGTTVEEIEKSYGELVRVEWRNFPLPFHPDAGAAAQAAVEVHAQKGDAGFWAFHDLLFANQSDLSIPKLLEYAAGVEGVDVAQVELSLQDGRHVARIQADMQSLIDSGAPAGTPASFINGRLISGAMPVAAFEDVIERALKETPEERAAAESLSAQGYPSARARHILIQFAGSLRAPEEVTRDRPAAAELAERLRRRAALGEDFAGLAQANSDGPSASMGGDLGSFTRGDLTPAFERVVFGIKPGEIGPVVETPFGYHVILRLE
jgi:protein-disulfide isomerase